MAEPEPKLRLVHFKPKNLAAGERISMNCLQFGQNVVRCCTLKTVPSQKVDACLPNTILSRWLYLILFYYFIYFI